MGPKILYRYDGIGSTIHCQEFIVVSETKCGYWVKQYKFMCDKKWVSKTAKKRLCYPTKSEALHNLICRRNMYTLILERNINNTKEVIIKCKKAFVKEKDLEEKTKKKENPGNEKENKGEEKK